MPLIEQVMYRFGPFLLDPTERLIMRDGIPLALTPKVFDTLLCLVRNCGRLLTKDELLQYVWPDTFVEEVNLAVNISTLRKVFGESPQESRYIATIPGRGYKFVAEVQQVASEDRAEDSPAEVRRSSLFQVVTGLGRYRHKAENRPGTTNGTNGKAATVSPAATAGTLKIAIRSAIVFLSVAAIAGLVWYGQGRGRVSATKPASIAVLPFIDLSPDKGHEYFSDGLTEELIGDLAKVPGLKVVARSSAFQFKGRNEDPRSVGRKLGVSNLLEGSVSVQGDRVRIRSELTKADDGFQIWSETYDRNIEDIFAVQDEIAKAATAALEVQLLSANGVTISPSQRTNSLAYQAYLQGEDFFGSDSDRASLAKALAYADQAIKLDASFAPAYALRSRILSVMAAYALTDTPEGYRRARESAERAIALNPSLPQGYLALGWVEMDYDWDWLGAEASLKKAKELSPGYAEVLRYQSSLYLTLGRRDEALELYKKVVALDPLHARSYSDLGYRYYFVGQYPEAEAAIHKALELNPEKEQDHVIRGQILLAQGLPQQALAEVERESNRIWRMHGEALAYHDLRRAYDSDSALQKLIAADSEDASYQIAQVYAYRGEADKAFDWLERAYRGHDVGLTCIKFDPLLERLHRDRRYAALVSKMHLPS